MAYRDTTAKLAEYRKEIGALREKMRALQKAVEPEPVAATASQAVADRSRYPTCSMGRTR